MSGCNGHSFGNMRNEGNSKNSQDMDKGSLKPVPMKIDSV
jgi:hypothetical protein